MNETPTPTDLETWKRALIAAADSATTPAGLLVAVAFAEAIRPWLEAAVVQRDE